MTRIALGCVGIVTTALFAIIAMVWFSLSPDTIDQLHWYAGLMVRGCMALPVVGIVGGVVWWRARQQRKQDTYRDGALPMQRYRVREWDTTLPWYAMLINWAVGYPGKLDPNRILSDAWHIRGGQIVEHIPTAGWDRHLMYQLAVEETNKWRSIAQGDDSRDSLFGRDSAPARLPGRALLGKTPAQLPPPPDDVVEGEFKSLPSTLEDALGTHKGNTILLGQAKDGTQALWNPQVDPHIGVWGKSGAGKTTHAGLTIAVGQLRQNWRVLIIDPEQEGDKPSGHWGSLAPWAQVVGPGEPGCTMWEQIMQWYETRWRNIQEAGATDAYHMPSGNPLRPLAIHFDEFARWREKNQTKGGEWTKYFKLVEDCLAEISQRGRKRGVHLTVYGQLPGDLPDEISGNLVNMTFKQAPNQGNKVGYWHAHNLGEGVFHYEGKEYDSFFPLMEAPQILSNRAPQPFLLTTNATVPNKRSSTVPVSESVSFTPVDTPPVVAQNDGTMDDEQWTDVVADWFMLNPQALIGKPNGINDLARVMCRFETGGDGAYEDYKSRAHRLYHAFRGNVRLPDGSKLGVDVTRNGNGAHV